MTGSGWHRAYIMHPALLCVAILLQLAPQAAAQAATNKLSITGFYLYANGETQQNSRENFAWPDDQQLSVMVQADLSGYTGNNKLELFLVLFDEKGDVVRKSKGKHNLPAGQHDLAFKDFFSSNIKFGDNEFHLELEATLKGAAPVKKRLDFHLSGPDAPHVEILEMNLYNPEWGKGGAIFGPGSEFEMEALIEIEDNNSGITPRFVLYGVMEEDSRDVDPYYEYQQYTNHWDAVMLPAKDGVFSITARGHLPYFYYNAWDNAHAFRIYAIVDFGAGERTDDYVRAELDDPDAGDHRRSDDLQARLIEMDRSWEWELKRLRAGTPETRDTWR